MERPSVIHKEAATRCLLHNWTCYAEERSRFSWARERLALQGLPGGGLNMGFEAVDRHAAGVLRYHAALRFVSRNAPAVDVSYAELARQTNRFANVLQGLGTGQGDRLFLLAGRIPELYVALLGALKNGTVVTPLFSALGPEPIATRIQLGAGQVLVTTDVLYQRKVRQMRAHMPTLRQVLLVAEDGGVTHEPETLDLATLMAAASDSFSIADTQPDDRPFCISPVAPPARPRVRCMCTRPW
ncbi:AMP-binding protein [Rhodoferax sp.]|uniref:AMP-binding protein n=1 Tax=Rhodoferax sp. TaxID=50421 RepID=UPI0025F3F378|nr:AMP-binding protein [Rhodoferax sp.]MCM2342618.1 AMP-binding protein [Rhodoferax sp.]